MANVKTSKLIFRINKEEFLVMKMPCPQQDVFRYDEVTIGYKHIHQPQLIIFKDFMTFALDRMIIKLKDLLAEKLALHPSITKDIGYLACRDFAKDKIKLTYELSADGFQQWIGIQYLLYDTPCTQKPNLSAWLYQKDDQVIFKITPNYQWHMPLREARKDKDYIPYKEFLKQYKPLVITTISRSTLMRWKKKVEKLIALVKDNDQKYLKLAIYQSVFLIENYA